MSNLTEVVLYVASAAADHEPEATALMLPVSEGHSPLTRIDTEDIIGDGKVFTSDVYLGVFNYIAVEEIVEFLKRVPWEDETTVVAVVNTENALVMTIRRRYGGAWDIQE